MPGGKDGLQELFKVVLALGDGVARNTIARLLDQDVTSWKAHAPAGQGDTEGELETWRQLESKLKNAAPANVDAQSLTESKQTYQPLVRSCATLARYSVLLATWRMIARGHTDGVDPDKLPAFHDPFAGGGALPLGAQRLGMEEDDRHALAEGDLLSLGVLGDKEPGGVR